MKKITYIASGLIVIALLLTLSITNDASERSLIKEAKNRVLREITQPDKIEFFNMEFLPDAFSKKGALSGAVCGYMDADMGDRHAGKIKVVVKLRSDKDKIYAGRALIVIPGGVEYYKFDTGWNEICKDYK